MSAAKYIGLYTSISIYLFSVQFLFLPVSHSVPRFSLYLFIYFFFFFRGSFQATGRQHPGYIIPQAVTHGLVLLKMGAFNARNMLS